jgi:hypothetical protein
MTGTRPADGTTDGDLARLVAVGRVDRMVGE